MTNEIDWTKAPEGATHWMPNGYEWSEAFLSISDSGKVKVFRGSVWYATGNQHSVHSLTKLGLKAKPLQPVFTKLMHQCDELPPIGSEYLDEDNQLCKALFHYNNFVIGDMSEHIQLKQYPTLSTARNDKTNIVTPPIELIDGKAYQFDLHLGVCIGLYCESENTFITRTDVIKFSRCTNIKLLEVKS